MTLLMSLAACSDDIYNAPLEQLPSDGKLTINFAVPEMETVQTRALAADFSDSKFDDVLMLVFTGSEASTAKLVQKELLIKANENNVEITIDENYRKNGNLFFLFLANSKYGKDDFLANGSLTMSDVISAKKEGFLSTDGKRMVLSGACSLNSLLKFETVKLWRNAAKVSVTTIDGDDDNKKSTNDNPTYAFNVYGPDSQSSSFAGCFSATDNRNLLNNPIAVSKPDPFNPLTINKGEQIFVGPTKNTGNHQNKSCIIVRGKYSDGNFYYYCLNFQNSTSGVLDILPNHYYEVKIKGDPLSKGYATIAEAMENPVSLSSGWYDIHDHSPKIFNMITDGMRELGVDYECRNSNSTTNTTAIFHVKLYSKAGSAATEYAHFKNNYTKYITFSKDWLKATGIREITSGEEYFGTTGKYDGIGYDEDNNEKDYPEAPDAGKIYEITVTFGDNGGVTGLIKEEATVTWEGLSRDVDVIWDREFDPAQLYESATLTIKGGGINNVSDIDYWELLTGRKKNGNQVTQGTPKVWGVSEDDNNGYSRNEGFHFAMPYGTSLQGNAQYTYNIELKCLGVEDVEYTWSYKLVGDEAITGTKGVKVETNSPSKLKNEGPELKLSYKDPGSFKYGVGQLKIIVNEGTESEQTIPINLYHTGFFHKDKTTGLASKYQPAAGRDWTYYEVVSMGNKHWLDRNLGAHSANMYIESTNDSPYMGDQTSAGGYYRAAEYNNPDAPKMRDIAPPGYDVPTQSEYNTLIASPEFSTESMGSYNTACYYADQFGSTVLERGVARKIVYFPKARYLDKSDAKDGESRSGYYWTQTAASGTEKEEVGAWLKSFMVSGAATTYINGEVDRGSNNQGYAMTTRCIYTTNRTENPKATSFFVKGATHVYLYTVKNGVRTPITSWPGTPICTADNLSKMFNVYYESSVNLPEDMYVIFNYKETSGKIHTYSRNASGDLAADNATKDKTILHTTDKGASQLAGWKVDGGIAPDWDNYPNATTRTKLKGYWIFDNTSHTGGFSEDGTNGEETVIIYGDYNIAYTGQYARVHYYGGNSESAWKDSKYNMTTVKGSDGKDYKVYKIDSSSKKVMFHENDNDSPKTGEFAYNNGEYVFDDNGKTDVRVIFKPESERPPVEIYGDYNLVYDGNLTKVHYWGGDSSSSYPGDVMATVIGSDGKTYKAFKVANNTKNILFATNGDSDKTGDFAYETGFIYTSSGKSSVKVVIKPAQARRKSATGGRKASAKAKR